MRKNLGKVSSKNLLPGLDDDGAETISLREVASLFGVRHSAARVAKLGLTPVDEVFQGNKVFRAYSRAQVMQLKAKQEQDDAKREQAFQNAVSGVGKEGTIPQPAADPTQRQLFGVMCEIRDLLKQQLKALAS